MCFSSWNKSNGNVISLRNCFSLYRVRIENICCLAWLRFGSAAVVCPSKSMCGRGVENCAIHKGAHVSRHCFYMYLFVHPFEIRAIKIRLQWWSKRGCGNVDGLLSDINQYYWSTVMLWFVWKFGFELQKQKQTPHLIEHLRNRWPMSLFYRNPQAHKLSSISRSIHTLQSHFLNEICHTSPCITVIRSPLTIMFNFCSPDRVWRVGTYCTKHTWSSRPPKPKPSSNVSACPPKCTQRRDAIAVRWSLRVFTAGVDEGF